MDSRIRVRFFQPSKLAPGVPGLEDALSFAFHRKEAVKDREITIAAGITVRIERFRQSDGFCEAEFVRVQRGNIPPEATDEGLIPLAVGGLGHSTVICFHPALNVMAVQLNHNMSVGRAMDYLHSVDGSFNFRADPLVRKDAWERYNRGRPRKMRLSIANPRNLPAVEGRVGALTDMSRRLAEMADAPQITLEVSMGHNKGQLEKGFVDSVVRLFTNGDARDHDIRNLTITTASEEGPASDPIDFLDDVLTESRVLDLPPTDTEAHFERRRSYVRSCFNDHMAYIVEVYGPKA